MNNLLPSTQSLLKDLQQGQNMVIISYTSFMSLMATMEEEMDEESKKSRQEAEKDIKKGRLIPFEEILKKI
ncbi:hypothetical protein A2966_00030 [Candidatus Roizmanbacteria bacterium RIFCSPLOWO2_01_FULL_41_22]|uniref:Uncharacterized protein n=2 Tax=Candidatus Roizmaniibacteriota TaxID=1752723 RepID=A0A1F7JRS5_9BACT|nr:MAG: hypothetical protein A2966_00030 [Candidatus Roizmanbacteria bacterium RIFCSPLOWO2_01_FULL_41_22]OGK58304.1 MAG: hypothetical protein A3H86_01540 [Candidatus Roizmanbacteria bacterium RIFCSPLOWO2_02_FULL_41_9]